MLIHALAYLLAALFVPDKPKPKKKPKPRKRRKI